ncbi:MAG: preprotein translocase subunit YajC [Aquificaceae bacterium]|nr:preprotein translocase subunit YajC [Aquificaceae bacterium]
MIDIAFAQQNTQGGSPLGALLFQLVFFLALFALFYFLLIRPQSKARKKHQEFLANLKKGDRVVTSGGIWGTVVEIGDDTVTLKVDANTRITFTKEAISHYQPSYKKEEKEKED